MMSGMRPSVKLNYASLIVQRRLSIEAVYRWWMAICMNSPEWVGNSDMIEVCIHPSQKSHKFQMFRHPSATFYTDEGS